MRQKPTKKIEGEIKITDRFKWVSGGSVIRECVEVDDQGGNPRYRLQTRHADGSPAPRTWVSRRTLDAEYERA